MICDKCGKSNISDLSECSYCGAKMPKKTNCGGFADILSVDGMKPSTSTTERRYEEESLSKGREKNIEGISEQDMQKLLKKSDSIIKSTQKNTLFGLVAIALGLLIFISSIVMGIITISSVKSYKEETMTQITETQKELEAYKVKIDTIISEIEGTDKKVDETEPKDKTDEIDKTEKTDDRKDNDSKKDTDNSESKGNNQVPNPSAPRTDKEGNIINQ